MKQCDGGGVILLYFDQNFIAGNLLQFERIRTGFCNGDIRTLIKCQKTMTLPFTLIMISNITVINVLKYLHKNVFVSHKDKHHK